MATIKSYTDIEQSKKLAEILPLESADMYYQYVIPKSDKIKLNPETGNPINALEWYNKGYTLGGKEPITLDEYCVPCWSLTALFGILPMLKEDKDIANPFIAKTPDNEYYVVYATLTKEVDSSGIYDNPIDACYDMIINLNKLKML